MIGLTRPDGSTLRLRFAHVQQRVERGKPQEPLMYLHPDRKRPVPIRAMTACFLETGSKVDPQMLAHGYARCAMADHFNKETGRQLALRGMLLQALDAQIITAAEHGMLLAAYFNRPRGPQPQPLLPHSQEPS